MDAVVFVDLAREQLQRWLMALPASGAHRSLNFFPCRGSTVLQFDAFFFSISLEICYRRFSVS